MYIADKISVERLCALRLKTIALLLFILVASQQLLAQVTDDFSDGEFTTNHSWHGSTGNYIINTDLQLQLNASAAGNAYLYTEFPALVIDDFQWEFFVKQSFAPSGGNFSRFYLLSDRLDLTGPLNGYYVQLGEAGSNDAVEIFRQTGLTSVSVCRGTAGKIAAAFAIRVQVKRTTPGLWELFVDYNGGSEFILEASGSDATHTTSAYTGLLCTYTVTNATRFVYDEISISRFNGADVTPPELLRLDVASKNELILSFSEEMMKDEVQNISNYVISSTLETPVASYLQSDDRSVHLQFADDFINGVADSLSINHLTDMSGNAIAPTKQHFMYFMAAPVNLRDVIISEIFADPSPQVGLPAFEFLELYNRSNHPVQLSGWGLSDGSSTGTLSPFILLPDQYVVLSSQASALEYSSYGKVVAVSNFPTLNNTADHLELFDQSGAIIDSVRYAIAWYRDEDKDAGGWSLEIIDPENICAAGENWVASTHVSGGSPGERNSVHNITPDLKGPRLLEATMLSEKSVQLVFDEKLHHALPAVADFSVEPVLDLVRVSFVDELFLALNLEFSTVIDTALQYVFKVQNIYDCPGNPLDDGYDIAYLNLDKDPPEVVSVKVTSKNTITIFFTEAILFSTAESTASYMIEGVGHPMSASLMDDGKSVRLLYLQSFENGKTLTITIRDVADKTGNVMLPAETTALYFEPGHVVPKDVIITEFLADPSPAIGLPEAEFLELYNRSSDPIDVSGWTITDGTTTCILPSFILLPDEFLILTTAAGKGSYEGFGNSIALSPFASLNNSGDVIVVKNSTGLIIDSLQYDLSWYREAEKSEGGWTMEIIDPQNICAAAGNWNVSESSAGGTPGKQNSVFANNPDNTGPKLVSVTVVSSLLLLVEFSEKLERTPPSPDIFLIQPELEVGGVGFYDASLNIIALSLSEEVQGSQTYTMVVNDIYDCAGNRIQTEWAQGSFVLPEEALPGDIIMNEILFNPRPTGIDFVEIYNTSNKTIDLAGWSLANVIEDKRENEGVISIRSLLIHPKEYRVFTEKAQVLKGEYIDGNEETFYETDLPPLNDDMGSVAIINGDGLTIDSLLYNDKLHSVFLQNDEGVSLERIAFHVPANNGENWRSASSTVGFATPGYVNSNYKTDIQTANDAVVVDPEIFQPLATSQDFTQIKYRFDRGGIICNVKILDQQGQVIRQIAQNELLGTEGFFRWDGEQDNGSKARIGYYLVWFEIFDAAGMLKTYRKRVAVY
jgi:hypothetical protein